jgi:hypothetical protein
MAKKKLQDKVTLNGELSIIPGGFIKDIGSDLNLEHALFEKLREKGYEGYDKFGYKIILEYKKE